MPTPTVEALTFRRSEDDEARRPHLGCPDPDCPACATANALRCYLGALVEAMQDNARVQAALLRVHDGSLVPDPRVFVPAQHALGTSGVRLCVLFSAACKLAADTQPEGWKWCEPERAAARRAADVLAHLEREAFDRFGAPGEEPPDA
jgi:hypothetical protein